MWFHMLDFKIKNNHSTSVKEKVWIRFWHRRHCGVVKMREQVSGLLTMMLHHVFFRLPCSALSSVTACVLHC